MMWLYVLLAAAVANSARVLFREWRFQRRLRRETDLFRRTVEACWDARHRELADNVQRNNRLLGQLRG